ncbi:MAG: BamA/TamA family outer membrane protein, partial [Plesiomonas shigelloides]
EAHWLPNAGVGYRFAFKPRVNIRLDWGVGRNTSGFYFQVNEAF